MGKYDGMTREEFLAAVDAGAHPDDVYEMVADVFLGGQHMTKPVELVVHWHNGTHAHYDVARKGMKARGWQIDPALNALIVQNGEWPGTRCMIPLTDVMHVQLNIGPDVKYEERQDVGSPDGA